MNRQLPHLGDAGRGVNRKRPHLGNAGRGEMLRGYMQALAGRLRDVRVCCGDWQRVVGPSPTTKHGLTAVFLDPPYGEDAGRADGLYGQDCLEVARDVAAWAAENGNDPLLRIALCGYEGEHAMPEGWVAWRWKARGGFGLQGQGAGRENAARETVWFSPHCLNADKLPLLALLEVA